MRNLPVVPFDCTPGYILIDPLDKDKKSDWMVVKDDVDKPYKGWVVAVGESKVEGTVEINPPVKVGDFVLYSIAGCEEFKMEFDKNPRYRFIIAPFGRVLGIFTDITLE